MPAVIIAFSLIAQISVVFPGEAAPSAAFPSAASPSVEVPSAPAVPSAAVPSAEAPLQAAEPSIAEVAVEVPSFEFASEEPGDPVFPEFEDVAPISGPTPVPRAVIPSSVSSPSRTGGVSGGSSPGSDEAASGAGGAAELPSSVDFSPVSEPVYGLEDLSPTEPSGRLDPSEDIEDGTISEEDAAGGIDAAVGDGASMGADAASGEIFRSHRQDMGEDLSLFDEDFDNLRDRAGGTENPPATATAGRGIGLGIALLAGALALLWGRRKPRPKARDTGRAFPPRRTTALERIVRAPSPRRKTARRRAPDEGRGIGFHNLIERRVLHLKDDRPMKGGGDDGRYDDVREIASLLERGLTPSEISSRCGIPMAEVRMMSEIITALEEKGRIGPPRFEEEYPSFEEAH